VSLVSVSREVQIVLVEEVDYPHSRQVDVICPYNT
jgi:hypothetical protein